MNGQVVATIENDRGAIGTIQLGHGLAPCDTARVARDRNDVLEDDVLGHRSKKCSPSTSPATPSSMILKNGSRAWKSSRVLTAIIGPRPRPRLRPCAARSRRNLSAPCRSSAPLSLD